MRSLRSPRVFLRCFSCWAVVLMGLAATAQGTSSRPPKSRRLQPREACRRRRHGPATVPHHAPTRAGHWQPQRSGTGYCNVVDAELTAGSKGHSSINARLYFIHGAKHRFALKCKFPMVGDVWLGQGDAPWIVAGGKTVFVGKKPG